VPGPDGVRWLDADPRWRERLAPCLLALAGGSAGVELVAEKPGRRRLARARLESGEWVFLKHYPPRPRERLRSACKRALGWSADAREWRMLGRLWRAGLRVPEPLAHAALPDGGRVVATRFTPGRPLSEALRAGARERRALLDAVGLLVSRLHAQGVVHRDLHVGNLLVDGAQPVLLDLSSALPLRLRRARLRDLGELDASLASRLSGADRARLAAAALALRRPFDASGRRALREVARASRGRARAHWRSRTRRALVPGRQYARLALREGRGLRLREIPESRVQALLAGSKREPGIAVERDRVRGVRAWLAACTRGSAARRAWRAGQGLRARGIPAERPLAFVESRRLGVPLRSALLIERLPDLDAAHVRDDPAGFLDALAALLRAMRERDVEHAALDAGALRRTPDGRLALGRLGCVRFRTAEVRFRAAEAPGHARCAERLAADLAPWLDVAMRARLAALLREDAAAPRVATSRPRRAADQRGAIVTQR
jgi:tRNA A-37 threonylcarbamoyl transferase component Bud32